ncbi:hypothetical protein [Aliarcobacter trophiarum]|nr:hypothetical protein [Aliarcobacter trophiarum]
MNGSINMKDFYIVDFLSSFIFWGKTFYDYIDEEFEEDDDRDWIKL